MFLHADKEDSDQIWWMRRHRRYDFCVTFHILFELAHDKTDNNACLTSKDSDQPVHSS